MLKPHSAMAPVTRAGSGAAAGTEFLARLAAKAFARNVGLPGMILSRRSPCEDRDGLFAFRLRTADGERSVNIDMPGLPLTELRAVPGLLVEPPQVRVDGAGWTWSYAVEAATASLRVRFVDGMWVCPPITSLLDVSPMSRRRAWAS